jgi:hypothetical protein
MGSEVLQKIVSTESNEYAQDTFQERMPQFIIVMEGVAAMIAKNMQTYCLSLNLPEELNSPRIVQDGLHPTDQIHSLPEYYSMWIQWLLHGTWQRAIFGGHVRWDAKRMV